MSKPPHGNLAGYRGGRSGDYRVVTRIDQPENTVLIVRVDHRPDVYRPR